MKVTMLLVKQRADGPGAAWVESTYDEVIFDEHNGVPDYFPAKQSAMVEDGYETAVIVVNVPDEAIEAVFAGPPEVQGEVVTG